MGLKLYNTLTRKKEDFQPLQPNKVKMYCCGVTPYGNTHIGHTRTFFSYDLLYRTLRDSNLEVSWARNITDIDDKIIVKANEENVHYQEIVTRYVTEQDSVLQKFDLFKPQFEPRATESLPGIIDIIQKLIDLGYAYQTTNGVYFRVVNFPDYGKLSGNKIADLQKGARIEVDEEKENPLDFVLWKAAKPNEPNWASPWGNGRPGWHIECSAMIRDILGDSIDIHMGGRDLIFPHHEAEIAQSQAVTNQSLAQIWMHCGMMTLDGEKMSKSTNHYVSIKEFLDKYPAEVLRLFFLGTNYTQPLDFTFSQVDETLKKLARIYRFVSNIDTLKTASQASSKNPESASKLFVFEKLEGLVERMRTKLNDDLNSSAALGEFFEAIRDINSKLSAFLKSDTNLSSIDQKVLHTQWDAFKDWIKKTMGILNQKPNDFYDTISKLRLGTQLSEEEIYSKIALRNAARTNKDWQLSDAIRSELLSFGIELQDSPTQTKWIVNI